MAMVPQQTHETKKSAARQFWDEQMEKHPTLHGILSILSSIVEFFLGDHFIVRLGHKVALTGGVIAETSLLFATLWVTADYTIAAFLKKFMSADLMSSFSSLSQAAFSLLPEIILASAIVTTIHHWKLASTNWQSKHWIWASLFTAIRARKPLRFIQGMKRRSLFGEGEGSAPNCLTAGSRVAILEEMF